MQPKSTVAIVVLLLIGFSLSVAGCTTNNQTSRATPSTTTHDAFLEKYLADYKNATYTETIENINAWNLTWINGTSAHLEWTDGTLNYVETFITFPTTLDATHYLNAMNLTAYSLCSTQYSAGGAFQKTAGHAPQTYKDYEWNEGSQSNVAEYRYHQITQLDNLLIISTEHRNAIEFGSDKRAISFSGINRTNYILTHNIKSGDWRFYKSPRAEPIYDAYMQSWESVRLGEKI